MIYDLGDRTVTIVGDDYYIADSAVVVGSVRIGNKVSVWFNAVVRADHGAIAIGDESNIQDGVVLHSEEAFDIAIGRGVTVAHKAMLHGCVIGDNSMIGVGAVVLNGARIGKNCIIGAGALVLEHTVIPDNSLAFGAPARVIRQVTQMEIDVIREGAVHYIKNFQNYKKNLRPSIRGAARD
jgi:carbonic anhydrase/acetyltransferase-like protein (isoleucine patch superfamily)